MGKMACFLSLIRRKNKRTGVEDMARVQLKKKDAILRYFFLYFFFFFLQSRMAILEEKSFNFHSTRPKFMFFFLSFSEKPVWVHTTCSTTTLPFSPSRFRSLLV